MAADTLTTDQILERISRDGLRRAVVAFRKPPVPSRVLQELMELQGAPEARQFVAAYPLSPGHLLEALAASENDPSIIRHLAGNPRTPPHLLSQLATHADAGVRAQAARHPQLPARELMTLAKDPEPPVRCALSVNASLRLPDQALLADDETPAVRLSLVGHSGLSPQAALVLASDSSAVVRVHAVAAAKVEDELLLGWAASEEEEIQLALIRREELSPKLWKLLLISPHAKVRGLARAQVKPDEVELYFLCTKGEPEERAWVAGLETLSRPLQSLLARDAEASVRVALAGNPSIKEDVARYFIGLAEEPGCVALASNPSVSNAVIQELAATRLPAVLRALAYREQLEPELARALVSLSPEFRRHWAHLGRTVGGLDAETARKLLTDPLPKVRALAVAGHAWRRADLYDIARDPLPAVRMAALRHPNAPEELLNDWTKDPDPEVAKVALQCLMDFRNKRQSLVNFAASLSTPASARRQGEGQSGPSSAFPPPRGVPFTTEPELPDEYQGEDTSARSETFSNFARNPVSDSNPGILNKLKRIFSWQ